MKPSSVALITDFGATLVSRPESEMA